MEAHLSASRQDEAAPFEVDGAERASDRLRLVPYVEGEVRIARTVEWARWRLRLRERLKK
jgi:hypothetical protein